MKKPKKNSRNEFGYPKSLRKNTPVLVKQQKTKEIRNRYGYPEESS